jgi:PAS domain S-box-containing protein
MLVLTFFAGFCLISAFITYALGIFVYAKDTSSTVNRLFLAVMLASTYWAIGEFLFWQAGSFEEATFWLKASSFWPIVAVFAVHFILTFTRSPYSQRKNLPVLILVLYLPAILISLAGLVTGAIFIVGYQPGFGYFYQPVADSPAYLAESGYTIVIMLFAAAVSFSAWRKATTVKARQQNCLVATGLAFVIVSGFLSGVLLPALGIYVPNLVFVGIVIFSLLIAQAILRYGLFTLDPATVVPDILRLMPDGLILTDMDGRIVAANASAAAILCFPEEDLPGCTIREFLPGEAYSSLMSAVRTQGTIPDLEVPLEQQHTKVVSIAGSQVKDPGGEPAGMVLIVRDISGRKEAERALQVANEKISLLSRLTRHDIGNLVTALWGYLELLKQNRDNSSGDSYLARSIEIVRKISDHLRFSREIQETGSYQPVWQPLGPMFEDTIRDLPHDGVAITSRIEPVEIFADLLAVKVIYNLVENALRHGEILTRIDISTREGPGGELSLLIEDDGVGIPDEDKGKIFRNGYGKHTGFGLALSRDILSLTGITIVETGAAGDGARFEITVPHGAWRTVRTPDS